MTPSLRTFSQIEVPQKRAPEQPHIKIKDHSEFSAEKLIQRALGQIKADDLYDLKYLNHLKQVGQTCSLSQLRKKIFLYSNVFKLYAEQKLFSGATNI